MSGGCTPVLTPFSLIHSAEGSRPSPPSGYFGLDIDSTSGARKTQSGITRAELSLYPPIHSMPNEILSYIFESGCLEGEYLDVTFRALIEQVSRRWRETAHYTPSIWSTYHISQGNCHSIVNGLPSFLKRSGDYPLNIHLNCFWDPVRTKDIMEFFLPHSKRWRHLSITTPGADIFRYLHHVPAPLLETLQICHFSPQRHLQLHPNLFGGQLPSLRRLALRNVTFKNTTLPLQGLHSLDIRGYGVWPEYGELGRLIGGSTNLQKLTLHVKPRDVLQDINPQDGCTIPLPALRSFDIITSEGISPHLATLPRLFCSPSLEAFVVKDSSTMIRPPACYLMQYSRAGPTSDLDIAYLRIRTSSLYHAWRSLICTRKVTTLELDSVRWPHWSNCMTVFAALPLLQCMIINNVDSTVAVSELGQPPYPFKVKTLKKLNIGLVKRRGVGDGSDVANFVGAFDIPALEHLVIRDISGEQWKHLVVSFTEKVEKYPALGSLTIKDLYDVSYTSPDPSLAFPNLRNLNLIQSPPCPHDEISWNRS